MSMKGRGNEKDKEVCARERGGGTKIERGQGRR